MKRFWMGIAIFGILLAASIGSAHLVASRNKPIAQDLRKATEFALSGQWNAAVAHAGQAQEAWENARKWTGIFTDHRILEEADALFAEMQVYGQQHDWLTFAAICARLYKITEAIWQAHLPQWHLLL